MDPMELRIAVLAAALGVSGLVIAGLAATALGTARASAKWPVAGRKPKRATPRQIGVVAGTVVFAVAAGLGASLVPLPAWLGWYWPVALAAIIGLAVTGFASVKLASKIELSALINSPTPGGGDPQTAMPPHPMQPSVANRLQEAEEFAYGQPYPGLVSQPDGRHEQPPAPLVPSPSSSPESVASHTASAGLHTTTPSWQSPAIGSPIPVTDNETVTTIDLPPDATPGWVYADAGDNWYMVISHIDGLGLIRLSDFTLVAASDVVGKVHVGGGIDITVWPIGDEEPAFPPATEQNERPEP